MTSATTLQHTPVAESDSARLWDRVLYALAFVTLFIFLQGWSAPLTGWAVDPSDSALLRNAFWPAYGFTLVIMLCAAGQMVRVLLWSGLLVVLVLLAFLSTFWSIDPDATLRRSIALAVTCLAGLAIAARWDWRAISELVAGNLLLVALASLAVALLLPQYGRMDDLFPGSWRGVYSEKNALGGIMALGVVACLAAGILVRVRRRLWFAGSVLCLVLVLFSTSKTALAAMAIGLACTAWVWGVRRSPASAVVFTWLAAVVLAAGAITVLAASDQILEFLGKDATLTGRTEIWEAAMSQGRQRPVWGWGYGVIWDHMRGHYPGAWIAHRSGFIAGHAHNGWIEVWLALGAVGLVAWSAYWFVVMVQAVVASYRHPGAYLALPLLAMISLRSLTEVPVFDYHDGEWTLFVLLGGALCMGWARDRVTAPGLWNRVGGRGLRPAEPAAHRPPQRLRHGRRGPEFP